jgi:hypothetical protein
MGSQTKEKEPTTISELIDRAAIAAARAAFTELSATITPRRQYFRLPEVAKLLGMRPRQLSNLVSDKYFGAREGVRRVSGKRVFIHWPTFEATVLSGTWKAPFTRRPRRSERNAKA